MRIEVDESEEEWVDMDVDLVAIEDLMDANDIAFGEDDDDEDDAQPVVAQAVTAALPVGAPVQDGTIVEVGEFAIVHYGIDVHLAEILLVDPAKKEYRVIFLKLLGRASVIHLNTRRGRLHAGLNRREFMKLCGSRCLLVGGGIVSLFTTLKDIYV